MKRLVRFVFRLALLAILAVVLVVIGAEVAVDLAARGRNFTNPEDVPHRRAALVLGTAKYVPGGNENLHYRYRMDAAAELFAAGRVGYVIVSGNGVEPDYDEPAAMRGDLIERGVPAARIYRDDAGLRTLDSVVRAADVFGVDDAVVVSQPEHTKRAIFIGRMRGQDVVGFSAKPVPFATDPKTAIRERLARVLALLDVTVLNRQPERVGGTVTLGQPNDADAVPKKL
jgi:SanA protein